MLGTSASSAGIIIGSANGLLFGSMLLAIFMPFLYFVVKTLRDFKNKEASMDASLS